MNEQFQTLFALQVRNMTARELTEFFDIGPSSMLRRLRRLRHKLLVRVVAYRRQDDGHRGKPSPVYGLGDPIQDVPYPPRISAKERQMKYIERQGERFWPDVYARRKERRERERTAQEQEAQVLWGQLGARPLYARCD